MFTAFRRAAPLLALFVGFVTLYGRVLTGLAHNWTIDPNYSHGFLIAPVACYLVWSRRGRLAAAAPKPSLLGLALIAGSLVVMLAGVLAAEVFAVRVSMLGVLAGAVLFVYGVEHLRIVAFPLGFLLLMIPLPAIIFNQVALPLQILASRLGSAALALAGVPVLREGNVLVLPHGNLEVAEACSGIRSLVSLLAIAIIYGCFVDPRPPVRVALAALAVPVAILVNGLRVAGTGILQETLGARAAADAFFHEFSGWVMFLVAFALLAALYRGLAALFPLRHRRTAAQPGSPPLLRPRDVPDAGGI